MLSPRGVYVPPGWPANCSCVYRDKEVTAHDALSRRTRPQLPGTISTAHTATLVLAVAILSPYFRPASDLPAGCMAESPSSLGTFGRAFATGTSADGLWNCPKHQRMLAISPCAPAPPDDRSA